MSQSSTPLHIAGMGAQARLGLAPRSIAAAIQGDLCRFEEQEALRRKSDGSPIVGSFLSDLNPRWPARERMRRLGIEAAAQALTPLLTSELWPAGAPLPMFISVPPSRPGMQSGEGVRLARKIMMAMPVPPDEKLSGAIDTSHEGGLVLLAQAAATIEQRRAEVCLVGGVDCFRDIELLHWLEDIGRLKGDEAPTGLVPGEGAAFLLVCSDAWVRAAGLQSHGSVTRPARALEPNPWYMGRPCLGEGLTEAVGNALALGLEPGSRAELTWCDLNGESWRAEEWSFAYLRTVEQHGEPLRIRHPADALGDVGAATAPLLVVLAALELASPRTEARSALVFAASDTRPYRSACVVLKGGPTS